MHFVPTTGTSMRTVSSVEMPSHVGRAIIGYPIAFLTTLSSLMLLNNNWLPSGHSDANLYAFAATIPNAIPVPIYNTSSICFLFP